MIVQQLGAVSTCNIALQAHVQYFSKSYTPTASAGLAKSVVKASGHFDLAIERTSLTDMFHP